jgi:NADPH:quinone reductase
MTADTMMAYVLDRPGALASLDEVPAPVPHPHEILIRVLSSSVNPFDRMAAAGQIPPGIQPYRFPAILGRDVCGIVVSAGRLVTQYRAGDKVFGFVRREYIGDGTFAEYVAVPEDAHVTSKPENISDIEAGCLGLASVTALQCIYAMDLPEGSALLINGATGGVGLFATQLASARGLEVVATARSGAEAALLVSLGAASTIDWTEDALSAEVRARYPNGVDGVIDLISGDEAAFSALVTGCTRRGGCAVTTRGVSGEALADGWRAVNVFSRSDLRYLHEIAGLVESRQLLVSIAQVYELARIELGFAALAEGVVGKVGLRVTG